MLSNRFISFEGGEGSGKSTVISKVKDYLESKGHKVLTTREPGGVPIAEKIREVILGEGSEGMDSITEMLLYAAARGEHLEKKVRDYLESDYFVLCDRFVDSSVVYQGHVSGLGNDIVMKVNNIVIGDLMPKLTFYLDVEPEIGLNRINIDKNRELNRLDLEGINFHREVRNGYLKLHSENPNRIKKIDANQSIDEVFNSIIDELDIYLEKNHE